MAKYRRKRSEHHLASLRDLWAQIRAASRSAKEPIVWTRDQDLIELARDRYL